MRLTSLRFARSGIYTRVLCKVFQVFLDASSGDQIY